VETRLGEVIEGPGYMFGTPREHLVQKNGEAYIRVFVGIKLRDISKQETVEYMLAMVDEMLTDAWVRRIKALSTNTRRRKA